MLLLFSVTAGCDRPCDCYTRQGTCVYDEQEFLARDCVATERSIDIMELSHLARYWTVVFVDNLDTWGDNIGGVSWCTEAQVIRDRPDILCHELYHLEICANYQLMDYQHRYFEGWVNPCQSN